MDELIDFLQKEDVKEFIQQSIGEDVNRIILNPPSRYKEHIKDIAAQILARQKAKGKLDQWVSNFDLIMPPPLSIEQASSQATCHYKKSLVSGRQLVDLTGGMGIDFLALCSDFEESTYVEKESTICSVFAHNATVLGSKSKVINDEASSFLTNLETLEKPFVYLDPARRDQQKSKVFKIEDCSPNLMELLPMLKMKAAKVLIKYSPLLDIHSILKAVSGVKSVHIVSVKNECKELLILIDFEYNGEPSFHCVNLESKHDQYIFKMDEERSSRLELGDASSYLLEPNSSIMKAGAFKKVAVDFDLKKIAKHTHLYTGSTAVEDFPGRVFKIIQEVDRKSIGQFAPNGKINVITRNYPLSTNELKKKWKLKDGGDFFLLAFKDQKNKATQFIAERVDS